MQCNGLPEIEPVAQLLPQMVLHRRGRQHGVFGQKTHQSGTVDVGTHGSWRHGWGRMGSAQDSGSGLWLNCPSVFLWCGDLERGLIRAHLERMNVWDFTFSAGML